MRLALPSWQATADDITAWQLCDTQLGVASQTTVWGGGGRRGTVRMTLTAPRPPPPPPPPRAPPPPPPPHAPHDFNSREDGGVQQTRHACVNQTLTSFDKGERLT
jgi:hypothetical protein